MQKVHDPVVLSTSRSSATCYLVTSDRLHTVRLVAVAVVVFWCLAAATTLLAQDTPDYFRQNCMNCHTIGGGRLTGPDLKDVTQRKDREWLANFMANPKAVIDSGDPYAQKIFEESRNVPMPTLPGLTKERLENLLDLIEAESKLEESQFKGLQISNKPFTDADRALGRAIFLGHAKLEAGGTSCISCHSMYDTPALGGGRLGPDLTGIYERLKGRKALSAWLMAPGTETMLPIFKNHPMTADEINALAAYFEASAGEKPAEPAASRVALLLMGLAGAAGLVFGFDAIWKRRFHSVRRTLVDATPVRGH
ncbi:MAG: c-type cytochrome [Planctomycetaceae bacterium]|nr:c-type cytochrome [Planctomycetales bacterium]MCB9937100.1 c-type cytochrome [Planctomycetaceae bacterium]